MALSKPVLLALPDPSPALAVEILPKGLVINRLLVNLDGKTHDLVVGPSEAGQHGSGPHKYQNTIIGRYANRLPVASHKISRHGISAVVQPTPSENARSSLHGGIEGFDAREWSSLDLASAVLFSDKEKASIAALPSFALFSLLSPDDDQGFPGTLLVEVLFCVSRSPTSSPASTILGNIYVIYRAKLQSANTVTPVNLTQHWGFNLDASFTPKDSPTATVADHTLFIKASKTLQLDEDSLSTGAYIPASPSFTRKVRFSDVLPPSGIDKFYTFDAPSNVPSPTRLPLTSLPSINLVQDIISPTLSNPVVELASPRSGLTLAFDSNQPGVQLYTANFFDFTGTRKPSHGWSGHSEGDGYGPQTFAFLEFHQPLAAWLHCPNRDDTLLTSAELYNSFVRIEVTFSGTADGE